MKTRSSLSALRVLLIGGGLIAVLALVMGIPQRAPETPTFRPPPTGRAISRAEFGRLIELFSEPEGYFDTDNFISNETSYLHVVDRLEETVLPGGVYFGVGPGQNLSYIVHAEPSLALIVDIRRQNMLQHLLFKVLIEGAADRTEFLCGLFSKDCSLLADPGPTLPLLLEAVGQAPSEVTAFESNLEQVLETLTGAYQLELTPLDRERIEYVYRSFFDEGLEIRFRTLGRAPSVRYPTLEELLLETDLSGRHRSYLADEASFAWLQAFQRENRLIPVVGDFAGNHALASVADFLEAEGQELSVFYASNVEFYLFGSPAWDRYLNNVGRLPFTPDAVFLRAYFPTYGIPHPQNVRGHRPTSLIQDVSGFLEDAASGGLGSYWDVVARHTH